MMLRTMTIAVIGEPTGWHVGRLVAAIRSRGHAAAVVRWPEILVEVTADGDRFAPRELAAADRIIVRGMPAGGLEEVIFRMDSLARLAASGIPVVNDPRSLEVAIDKYLSLSLLAGAGLAVPRTIVAQTPESIEAAWASLGCDAVIKPLFGSRGRGIERINCREDLDRLLQNAAAGGVFYLQEFVPHAGWDARILVIGDRTFAMRRRSDSDWRLNVSRGALAEFFAPPDDWRDLARRAAAVVGAAVAGVDLLPATDGRLLVVEINAVPGWQGLQSVSEVDIADTMVDWVAEMTVSGRPNSGP
jgi:ribosomal protein S6--L-glutamate ligase